jgi:hypothetical protein
MLFLGFGSNANCCHIMGRDGGIDVDDELEELDEDGPFEVFAELEGLSNSSFM